MSILLARRLHEVPIKVWLTWAACKCVWQCPF